MHTANRTKHANFEQRFEESSANISESNYGDPNAPWQKDNEGPPAKPIQLLSVLPNGQVKLNDEALDIIAEYNERPVGFVALVGKYRSGKSFLLNKLLYIENNGFRVDKSTQACTQGIWMWPYPMENREQDYDVFFIDTQGLASLQKNEQNDTKIFTLATLISSYLIYNSQGCIDERSISDLKAVTQLSRSIMTEERLSAQQNERRLKDFMPSFCWLIRDFTLELRDERGRSITSAQYLENCLREESAYSRNGDSNKVKKSLLALFRNRDCVTLARPAREENEIQALNSLQNRYLRREFVEGLDLLRQKIYKNAGCKMYEGKALRGCEMADMIQAYVKAINEGKLPTIKSAWQQVSDYEGNMAYSAAHQKYMQLFEANFGDDQPKQQKQLNRLLSKMKQQAIDEFNRNCSSQNDEHSKKLREWIAKYEDDIRDANQKATSLKNVQVLRSQSHGFNKKVEENYYVGKKDEYIADRNAVIQSYRKKAIGGQSKQALLVQFMQLTNEIGLNLDRAPQNYQDNAYLIRENQQKWRLQQQANKSKTNQMAITAGKAKKEEEKKLKKDKDKAKGKVEKAGCCGGKCQIM